MSLSWKDGSAVPVDEVATFSTSFQFPDVEQGELVGELALCDVEALPGVEAGRWRRGMLRLGASGGELALTLAGGAATRSLLYLHTQPAAPGYLSLLGLPAELAGRPTTISGQFILGGARTALMRQGIREVLATPPLAELGTTYRQEEIVCFPILREGMKYDVVEALWELQQLLCDEVVVDVHHVAAPTRLQRRARVEVFKDKDLTAAQRSAVRVAIVADSIAGGVVFIHTLEKIREQFPNLERVEAIAPLTALYGAARIASRLPSDCDLRITCFETLLHALPPDYYYSAHHADPAFHLRPDAQAEYEAWWGPEVAASACAGYGWSEAFFHPRRQVAMIGEQLRALHGIGMGDLPGMRSQLSATGRRDDSAT